MNYHNITYPDMNNGDGLRVVLWLSACSHHCKGCQNPQTWDADSGILFDEKAREELFRELDKEYISGLTLSGGDPLNEKNLIEVLAIVTEFNKRYNDGYHFSNKTIWLYSGYTWDQIMYPIVTDDFNPKRDAILNMRRDIVSKCNILIDGKYIESMRNVSLKWRGSSNQRVIDIKKSLQQNEVILYCD